MSDEDLQNTVGFNFLDKIDYALSKSKHLVLLASENAFNSVYVRDEYQAFYSDCHVREPNQRLLISDSGALLDIDYKHLNTCNIIMILKE